MKKQKKKRKSSRRGQDHARIKRNGSTPANANFRQTSAAGQELDRAWLAYKDALIRLRSGALELPHFLDSPLVAHLVLRICDEELESAHANDFLTHLLLYAAAWKPRGKPSKYENITRKAYFTLKYPQPDPQLYSLKAYSLKEIFAANPATTNPTFKEVYMKVLERMGLDHPSDKIERNVRHVLDKNKKEFPLRMWKGSGDGQLQ
jgi:hypothetical protein